MNASTFISLPASQKKKIVRSAIRGANKDQRNLMERYEREFGTKKYRSGDLK